MIHTLWMVLFAMNLTSTALAAPISVGRPQATCTEKLWAVGNLEIQEGRMGDHCFVSLRPNFSSGMVFRNYLFVSDGLFMVFNSFGDGPESEMTGAREFFFFPRNQAIRVKEVDQNLVVSFVNGDEFTFDSETAQIKNVGRGSVRVAPQIRPRDRGGVEFPQYNGLILDVGFAVGTSPRTQALRPMIFRDHRDQTCLITGKEVFESEDGEFVFRYTDAALKSWLKDRCPTLSSVE